MGAPFTWIIQLARVVVLTIDGAKLASGELLSGLDLAVLGAVVLGAILDLRNLHGR